jgi:hypothetical protein
MHPHTTLLLLIAAFMVGLSNATISFWSYPEPNCQGDRTYVNVWTGTCASWITGTFSIILTFAGPNDGNDRLAFFSDGTAVSIYFTAKLGGFF